MKILDEYKTIKVLLTGKSLSRFGDGEIKLVRGRNQKSQPGSPKIAKELGDILKAPHKDLLVGIPRIYDKLDVIPKEKQKFWKRYTGDDVTKYFNDITYGSAFISRPDAVPQIQTQKYWDLVTSLFENKNIYCIHGEGREVFLPLFKKANNIKYIAGPTKEAWNSAKSFLNMEIEPDSIIYISLGPTATYLASEFTKMGFQAIDGGRMGGAYKAFLNNDMQKYIDGKIIC